MIMIETERLILRPWQESEAGILDKLMGCNRCYIFAFISE